ncbi:MAG: hypothetical protein PHF19_01450 [Synergistales bacterium]|nr:hypothetical protein [Synergistales bacterium]
MTTVHRYRCAACGSLFSSERHESKCPVCRGKILIHLEGEPRPKKSCSGSCSSCGGCGGQRR